MIIVFLTIFKMYFLSKLASTGGELECFRVRGPLVFAFEVFLGWNSQDL